MSIFGSTKYGKIYDENFNEVLQDVIIMDADVREDSKIMDHPLENGAVVSDHRIIYPKEVILKCALPANGWEDTYAEISKIYNDSTNSPSFFIETRAAVYAPMHLVGIPHKESVDTFSRLFYELRFRQARIVNPSYVENPVESQQNPASADTETVGQLQATEL